MTACPGLGSPSLAHQVPPAVQHVPEQMSDLALPEGDDLGTGRARCAPLNAGPTPSGSTSSLVVLERLQAAPKDHQ